MRAFTLKYSFAAFLPAILAGCASNSGESPASTSMSTSTQAVKPANLAPGEQIDYAGHRCGNPNLYVKTHLCIFPRR
ncbi:hypothetical protein [Paraburkholderia sp. RL17-381-BIF-C]|jgi:hypothetical protein|uniref:hypothetical protein n=1 Tax=Paraburkholderia sp. RL17-381-BIF-C TaxID=3031635 RepID=UPI0038B98AD2